jgi:hypothetical protein
MNKTAYIFRNNKNLTLRKFRKRFSNEARHSSEGTAE